MRRIACARTARAGLFWGAFGLIAGQILLGAAIDQALPAVRDQDYLDRLARMKKRRTDSPVLVALGSSRTGCGFLGDRLHPTLKGRRGAAVNYGRPGAGPMVQLTLLRRLVADGAKPDAVLVEFMPLYFNDGSGRLEDEKWLEDNDAGRYNLQEIARLGRYCKSPASLASRWGLTRGLPCVRQRHALQSWANAAPHPETVDDVLVPVNDVSASQRRRYTDAAVRRFSGGAAFDHFRLSPKTAAALHDLLSLCRKEGIETRLILMPESDEFRSLYSPEMVASCNAYLDELRREWGFGLIDAREWVADEGFSDGHHLLPAGAAAFTDRLSREWESRSGADAD